jgi:hypothetical protein
VGNASKVPPPKKGKFQLHLLVVQDGQHSQMVILLTTRTGQAAVETFIQLKEQSEQLGLIMNTDKTKYLM